ncbi:hypothetical protein KIW84_030665 [Lathyrus oleraceus]|uniref:Uncharacterized protein n=1 Tax=Pisum sativum TaxID=3888 RepID=A0A9D5AU95_PEA|nr:hypothetical protein KIW84_030665 [Pisum sativum]
MSLVSEGIKSESEIYYGEEICQVKSKELPEDMCLPKDLLPLKDIIEVGHHRETGKIKKMSGVKSKELFIWVTLSDIYVDDPPTEKVTFQAPAGLSRTFPVSAFELEEKSSGVKEV